jgi:probable rRNA maturation factor
MTTVARSYQIDVLRRSPPDRLRDGRIRRVVEHVLRRHRVPSCSLEIVILGEAGITRLNRRWLGHDGPTDVIAFDLGEAPARQAGTVTGQINVCWPIARRQAARRGHAAAAELVLYVVHGLLHLLGHDDHDPRTAARMHRRENQLLGELGFGRVFV